MKKAGIAFIALGFYCVLFAFNMDVVVGTTYNIGLMNERQNVVYLSGIIFLAGIILFGFGFSAKEESKNFKQFAIACFLSPVLLLFGIKIVVSVQESIKQESIRKKNAIDFQINNFQKV
jgi:NADH:ubiquinone oxidoreductase subunit 6 (subunit J)